MLVGYDGHIIYRVYLPDKEKIICINNLKIVENEEGKADSHVTSYNAITASQDDIISNTPCSKTLFNFPTPSPSYAENSSPFPPYAEPSSFFYTQTRSGWISKPPKHNDMSINNNVQILLSQLTKVFDIHD